MALIPVLKSLQLRNVLSFGGSSETTPLTALNVLIGPNGAGKSNLIEAIGMLRAAPQELSVPVRQGGGIQDWVWKGSERGSSALIEAVVEYAKGKTPLRYKIAFREVAQRLEIVDERVENETKPVNKPKAFFFFGYENGYPYLNVQGEERALQREEIRSDQSILSQRKDPDHYPEITYLGRTFESIRLYREWSFGRYTPSRVPQPADLPNDFLLEDASNLALVLNRLTQETGVKRRILEYLKKFYEGIEDYELRIQGGTVQIALQEGDYTIPGTRLSDGTLRWLALLSILLHPSPPPLVCLEEPEIGLHPDMQRVLGELLLDASSRMQLVVTTHSDTLVDSLNDHPEAVVVCEKVRGTTVLKRLGKEELGAWLDKYTLGELWRSGEIGGNRW